MCLPTSAFAGRERELRDRKAIDSSNKREKKTMAPKKAKSGKTASGSVSPAKRNLRSSGRVTRSTSAKLPGVRKHFQELSDKRKQNKKQKKEKAAKTKEVKAEPESPEILEDSNKTIVVIEHCKQCNSFKTRANQVKEGLEKSTLDVVVKVNPEKPRRGCFEIRLEGGKQFISLLDLKRPFNPMKDLDMDKVISDIIDDLSQTS